MFFIIAFAAGLVRGYSGFGFAMLMALGLMLQLPPAEAVPVALILDVACSVTLWPAALRAVHGRVFGRLLLGMLLAVPLGACLLLWLPAGVMAPLVASLCLCGGLLVLWRPPVGKALGQGLAWLAGLASGLATAMASAGGPPLMIYLLRSGLDARQLRGTAVLFFLASSFSALIGLGVAGVLTGSQWRLALELALPALAGNLLGQWLHPRWQPLSLRVLVGGLLVLLSLGSLLKAIW
ncbi:hypothetical protein SAMN03159511_1477 [Pseudomonas sp. NFACC19-2]|nr:sulfite exporter TauE/SafE family protein [Pseudomonas sp. NFACC19-2]SFW21478.1 hypothetical protein SAMN03159511_1477 [Pseudomonas sp. NFACC19-2]